MNDHEAETLFEFRDNLAKKARETYRHPDRRNTYYKIDSEKGFALCQVNGSLSSIHTYESEQQAFDEGWVKQ